MITVPNFFGAELPKKFRVRPISNLFSKENRQITHNSIFADLSHFEIRFGFHRAIAGKGEGGLIQSCAVLKTKLSKIDIILLSVQSKTRPSPVIRPESARFEPEQNNPELFRDRLSAGH